MTVDNFGRVGKDTYAGANPWLFTLPPFGGAAPAPNDSFYSCVRSLINAKQVLKYIQ